MKHYKLVSGWMLRRFLPEHSLTYSEIERAFRAGGTGKEQNFAVNSFPAQVHDVLLAHGMIENPNIKGHNHDLWIHDCDWAYRCEFMAEPDKEAMLEIQGLDTFADVYINGTLVKQTDNAFLYYEIPVANQINENNVLLIYFHSARKITDAINLPEKYQGLVSNISAARVFRSGYHDYCGPKPALIRCGIYGEVLLKQPEQFTYEIRKTDTSLSEDFSVGTVTVEARFFGNYFKQMWKILLYDQSGRMISYAQSEITGERESLQLEIDAPELWYPRNYGESPVYKLVIEADGIMQERYIGFRKVIVTPNFKILVNDKKVRLWGANLTHPDTMTNVYDRKRMRHLLNMAELCHCNTMRVWGESERYPDEFYEECDKRGIFIWQDFYLCCAMYSEESEFMENCRTEAQQLVKSLRHHPCILLWCGGNELYLARDYNVPDSYCFGEKIVREVFAEVCRQLDPERMYHISSPYGGTWANDPSIGDTHGYTHLWFVPGREFPVFLSENNRVAVPPLRTLKRMMEPQELWPADYDGKVTKRHPLKWPEPWCDYNTNDGHLKLGPVEHYFDPENLQELIYRINQAYAEYLHKEVGRFRRGYAGNDDFRERKTQGHLIWKWNNNSNIISYGVLDYFGEPNHAWYELKRCYQPFYLSCELSDHGYIWLTNDTGQEEEGIVKIQLFDLQKNCFIKEMQTAFYIGPDESFPICTLDEWGQFYKRHLICTKAYAKDGSLLASSIDCAEMERNLKYPEHVGLTIHQEGNELVLESTAYARCIELTGNCNSEEFGWIFEDNYFDLLPREQKRIKIKGRHKYGNITAKAFYDEKTVSCSFLKRDEE